MDAAVNPSQSKTKGLRRARSNAFALLTAIRSYSTDIAVPNGEIRSRAEVYTRRERRGGPLRIRSQVGSPVRGRVVAILYPRSCTHQLSGSVGL